MDKKFQTVIGKDVIESLTLGMYDDSRFIYREYVQNAADQIDKAIKDSLLDKEQGEIHITIDEEKRVISVEDNATGIAQSRVQPILQNIAQSTKQRGIDKGFRGIGRLGGLAYCEKLVFETSVKGETSKTILTWDAALLKDIINNRKDKEDAVSVIERVTGIYFEDEDIDRHYFRVILIGVSNDELLNKDSVAEYLSMVAPLPFSTKFIFRSKIYDELKNEQIHLDEYKIYLNSEQLFKAYSTYVYDGDDMNKRKVDEVIDIVFFKSKDSRDGLIYWGWYGVSTFNRQLRSINLARGFRLRKSNIQIGNEYTLLKLHRDNRFNFYFFGEIHGVHQDLIPNSRRDYFIENDICALFEQKLRNYFHTHIYKLCYTASEINSSLKKIEDLKMFEIEFRQKNENGFTDKKEHSEYRERFEQKKEEALKAKKKIEKIEFEATKDDSQSITKILNRVSQPQTSLEIEGIKIPEDNAKPKFRVDNLSSLNKDERKFLARVFIIIRDVLDADIAENLIQKIEEELK
jgi:molecular chaperone HtpG